MDKAERLEYMKKRFKHLEDNRVDAVIAVSKRDVQDEIGLMDGFREFQLHQPSRETLTSDER